MKKTLILFWVVSAIAALACPKIYAQVNLQKGLIAWYPCNGNVKDGSGNGNNGTVGSATPDNDRYGRGYNAYLCTGSSKGINVTGLSDKSAPGVTISFWIKTTLTSTGVQIVQGSIGVIYIGLFNAGKVLAAFDGSGGNNVPGNESTTKINNGAWYNVTATNDGSTTRIYINGKLENSYSETLVTGSSDFTIGNESTGFAGDLDDIRVYNRAVTDNEALAIYQMPLAAFQVQNVCAGSIAAFSDSSNTVPSSTYWWDFGDKSAASTLQSPKHAYASPGTYKVAEVVTSPAGSFDTAFSSITVYPLPMATFIAGAKDHIVSLIPLDTSLAGYNWNFGDSSLSIAKLPVHVYASYGKQTITLTTTNKYGCDSTAKKTITLTEIPKASFTVQDMCFKTTFFPQNTSTASVPMTYFWDFGDGKTGTSPHPAYTYANPGQYRIRLKVSLANGNYDTISQVVNVFPLPSSDFSFSVKDHQVSYDAADTSAIAWNWDMGDNSLANIQKPVHYYLATGTYQATLVTKNKYGCSSVSTGKLFVIHNNPAAAFGAADVCFGEKTFFIDSSTYTDGNIITFQWNFGDGNVSGLPNPYHTYTLPGNYSVQLIVVTKEGYRDTIRKTVHVYELPAAGFSMITNHRKAVFKPADTALASYTWDFGDSSMSHLMLASHTYGNPGHYTVSLTTRNKTGCDSTLSKFIYVNDAAINMEGSITDFAIYPDPVINNTLNLKLQTLETNLLLTLYNLEGKKVYTMNLHPENGVLTQTISLPGLSSGIYMLRLYGRNDTVNKKIVVR